MSSPVTCVCFKICKNELGLKTHLRSAKCNERLSLSTQSESISPILQVSIAPVFEQINYESVELIQSEEISEIAEVNVEVAEDAVSVCTYDIESPNYDDCPQEEVTQNSVQTESIQCSKCNQNVADVAQAKVICHGCLIGTPMNNRQVPRYFQRVDEQIGDVVIDLKPVVEGRIFSIYAPTQANNRRLITPTTLNYQISGTESREISIEQYKATTWDVAFRFNEKPDHIPPTLSLFHKKELDQATIKALYQQNPKIGECKKFQTKLLIDYDVKFELSQFTRVFIDTETSKCDNDYRDLPLPHDFQSQLVIIQYLICSPFGKPVQRILHRKGYTYNAELLKKEFSKVSLEFLDFYDERQMVDHFWNDLIAIKGQVVLTGFNACHDYQFNSDKADRFEQFKHFCGYDLKWLTARTSYKFTPNNSDIKIDASTSTIVSQIRELPNVLCIDYQGLALRRMDQKVKNNLDATDLKSVLNALFGEKSEIGKIAKLDQNIYELQRICHQQAQNLPKEQREDMTDIMRYSINDTVCLMECDNEINYITDQLVPTMEMFQLGISQAFTFTQAQQDSLMCGRMLKQRKQAYKCVPLYEQGDKITGAYTNNEAAYVGKTVKFAIQDDFNSLYPSVIINYNISQETFVCETTEPTQYPKEHFSLVEVSDDNKYKSRPDRTFLVFDKTKNGVLSEMCVQLMKLRKQYKNLMENEERENRKGGAAWKRFNQLQLLAKVAANSLYGNAGNKADPYYKFEIGCAITAGARNALQCLNRAVSVKYGFMDQPLMDRPEMFQLTHVKTENNNTITTTEWIRDYFNKQENAMPRIVQNDTDASFYRISDMNWFVEAKSNPERQAELYKQFHSELQELTKEYLGGSEILKFECEEFIVALLSSQAKKSYIRLDIKGSGQTQFFDHYVSILNQMVNEDESFNKAKIHELLKSKVMELQIKGVQWSNFHGYMRDFVRELFLDILLSNEVTQNVNQAKCTIMNEFLDSLKCLINGETDGLQQVARFAKRIKLTGKSALVKHIKQVYDPKSSTVYVLPLRPKFPNQKKSELYMPIEFITAANRKRINDQAVLDLFNTQIKKFFDNGEKKAIKQRQEIICDLDDSEVLIRLETLKNKQYTSTPMQPSQIAKFVENNPKYVLHEVIHNEYNKLYFDIDDAEIDLFDFEEKVQTQMARLNLPADIKMFVAQRGPESSKRSYHITFDIVMSLYFNQQIAQRLQSEMPRDSKGKSCIDLAVYAINKSLRVPFSHKLKENGEPDRTSILYPRNGHSIEDLCVTFIDGYRFIQAPLACSERPVIQFDQDVQQIEGLDQIAPLEYTELLKNVIICQQDIEENSFYKKASMKLGILCPACNKDHKSDNDNKLTIYQTATEYKVRCFRSRSDGQESVYTIKMTKEQKEATKQLIAKQKIRTNTRFMSDFLPTQSQQYVTFDIDSRLNFIKSSMGSGKTEILIKLLEKHLKNSSAVMLSTRLTLTTDWIQRYQSAGLQMIDYRDVKGSLNPQNGQILVVQVDSLCRLNLDNIGILILDEIESIKSQLNSSQLADKTGVDLRFIQTLISANKIVCLDALLHDSTIRWINDIVGEIGHLTWNQYKTYAQNTVYMKQYQNAKDNGWIRHYISRVEQGKNIIGHINSKRKLLAIVAALKGRFPDIKIRYYHGDDTDLVDDQCMKTVKDNDLRNVNEIWKQYQVVLFTGTISCGVDFNQLHFHENISIFSKKANTADQFMQGLMRCRKLIDNKITIYTSALSKQFTTTPKRVLNEYLAGLQTFAIGSSQLTDKVFNTQLYLKTHAQQLQIRAADIIVASLNEMGMNIKICDIDYNDQEDMIEKQAKSLSWSEFFEGKCQVSELAAKLYVTKDNDALKNQLMSEIKEARISDEIKMISMAATLFHNVFDQYKAFDDFTQIQPCLNHIYENRLFPILDASDEFGRYMQFRTNYKAFALNNAQLIDLDEYELDAHLKTILTNHSNQFVKNQKLRGKQLQSLDLPKFANEIRSAHKFAKSWLENHESEETKKLAALAGYGKSENYKYIFIRLGLVLKTESVRSGSDVSRKRYYKYTIRPLLNQTPIATKEDPLYATTKAANEKKCKNTCNK